MDGDVRRFEQAVVDSHETETKVSKVETPEARAPEPEPLLFEQLPAEQQEQILGQLLDGMRDAIGPVRDYAVFASTAMYLNGEKIVASGDEQGRELMKPPGDFDAAVWKLEDLDEIRNRMRRMPDVIFSNAKHDGHGRVMRDQAGEVIYDGKPGEYGTIHGHDLKILAGKRIFDVELDGRPERVAYDFEFFLNSRMVRQEAARGNTTEARGLKILNLDGLQRQYAENLNFELKVDAAVKKIVEYLGSGDPEVETFKAEVLAAADDTAELSEHTWGMLQHFEVDLQDMKKALEMQTELDAIETAAGLPFTRLTQEGVLETYIKAQRAAGNEERAQELAQLYKRSQDLVSKRATLLAGAKTKIWKRDLNLVQLARLRQAQE